MRTLLWAAVMVAVEALLVWGYFVLVRFERIFPASAAEALLVGTVSVLIWLGYRSGFEQVLYRLVLALVGCVIFTYVALLADLPTAVVCERGRTEVEAEPHILGGRFEERHIGPCVFFNPEAKHVPGIRGGNAVGD